MSVQLMGLNDKMKVRNLEELAYKKLNFHKVQTEFFRIERDIGEIR